MHYKNQNILRSLQATQSYNLLKDHDIQLSSHSYQLHPYSISSNPRRRTPPYLLRLSSQLHLITMEFRCQKIFIRNFSNMPPRNFRPRKILITMLLIPPHPKCMARDCLNFFLRWISTNTKIQMQVIIHTLLNITSENVPLISNLMTLFEIEKAKRQLCKTCIIYSTSAP